MFFLVDDRRKFIIGWSAKCACTSVKKWFIQACDIKVPKGKRIHSILGYGQTRWSQVKGRSAPGFPEKYKKFVVVRDPYKRLVSGYIDKIIINSKVKKYPWRNFEDFVSVLIKDTKFKMIDAHHFIPQTRESFRHIAKTDTVWDLVLDVDSLYEDFQKLNSMLKLDIDVSLHNETQWRSKGPFDKPVYLMEKKELERCTPYYRFFYNDSLLKAVEIYYQRDFEFLGNNGIQVKRPI